MVNITYSEINIHFQNCKYIQLERRYSSQKGGKQPGFFDLSQRDIKLCNSEKPGFWDYCTGALATKNIAYLYIYMLGEDPYETSKFLYTTFSKKYQRKQDTVGVKEYELLALNMKIFS